MNRENRNLLINGLIFLLLSLTLILGYDAILSKVKNGGGGDEALSELFGFEVTLADEETITNNNVKARRNVLNSNNEVVGAIYTLVTDAVDYIGGTGDLGVVELTLTITSNKEILAYEFITYEHTTQGNFQTNVIEFLDSLVAAKKKINEVIITSGTGSTNTKNAIGDLLDKLNDFIDDVQVEPNKYDVLFGEQTNLDAIININDENLLSKQDIKNTAGTVLGTSYVLITDEIEYRDGNPSVGTVKLELVLKADETLLGYEFIEYGHTGNDSNWQKAVITLLNSFISDEKKLEDLNLGLAAGTGATNTNTELIRIFLKLKDYLDGNLKVPTKYDLLFGVDTELGELLQIGIDNLISEQAIKDLNGNVLGTSYILITDEVTYYGTNKGTVKIELIVKDDETVFGYEFVEYGHTGNDSNWQTRVKTLLNGFISDEKKLADLNPGLATGTGATNTNTALLDVFTRLKGYLDGNLVAPTKYDVMFGEITELDNIVEIVNDNILSEQVIKDLNGTVLGTSYVLITDEVTYYGSNKGTVKFELIIKADETILGYEFIEYGHTGNDSNWQTKVKTLLDSFVTDGKKLADLNPGLATGTGATNTNTALLDVFVLLKAYLDGGL